MVSSTRRNVATGRWQFDFASRGFGEKFGASVVGDFRGDQIRPGQGIAENHGERRRSSLANYFCAVRKIRRGFISLPKIVTSDFNQNISRQDERRILQGLDKFARVIRMFSKSASAIATNRKAEREFHSASRLYPR